RRDGSGGVEEILGVELLVADELKGAAVHTVRTGLGNSGDDDPRISAILGRERIGQHLELLHHLDVRLEGNLVLHHVAEVDAVKNVVGGVLSGTRSVNAGDADAARHSQK